MPKQFQKTIQNYISKMKKPTKKLHLPTKKLASSTSWILRGCKHPRTPSFSIDRHVVEEINHVPHREISDAATLSDIDRFLFDNFRSLYQKEYDENLRKKVEANNQNNGVILFEQPPRTFLDFPANFPGSSRLFFDHSASGSLIEEARTSMTTTSPYMDPSLDTNITLDDSKRSTNVNNEENNNTKNSDDFITLLAYSSNPYEDFKKSMHEMIEARIHFHGKVDWEFMEELLFCFLDMNDKKLYKFILRAFVDLNVVLRENSGKVQGKSRNVQATSVRRRKIEF